MYIAYVVQQGGGCDYTIGCAQTVLVIAGETEEEAKTNLTNELITSYGWSLNSEIQFTSLTLFKVEKQIKVDLSELLSKMVADEQERNATDLRRRELQELQRLQSKYGK